MFGSYEILVHETGLGYESASQEALGLRLDNCLRSPYTAHLIVGRNGSDELLFVPHEQTRSDKYNALKEACGVYFCKIGIWPDFVIGKGEIHKLSIQGEASPACLEFADRRRMLVLTADDTESYGSSLARLRLKFVSQSCPVSGAIEHPVS